MRKELGIKVLSLGNTVEQKSMNIHQETALQGEIEGTEKKRKKNIKILTFSLF